MELEFRALRENRSEMQRPEVRFLIALHAVAVTLVRNDEK